MSVLALHLSTSTGWAFFSSDERLVTSLDSFGAVQLEKPLAAMGPYPWNYVDGTRLLAEKIGEIAQRTAPDRVIIEETCLGKSSYAQKSLEMLHLSVLHRMRDLGYEGRLHYARTVAWRQTLGLKLSARDRANNKILAKARRAGPIDKASLGIRGKVTVKHLSVDYANRTFSLQLKRKDDDKADAICLGWAELNGVSYCDEKGV